MLHLGNIFIPIAGWNFGVKAIGATFLNTTVVIFKVYKISKIDITINNFKK